MRYALGFAYVFPAVALAILFVIFNSTDPISIGPAGIFGVFLIMYFLSLDIIFIVLHLVHQLKARMKWGVKPDDPSYKPPNYRRSYYVASVLAFAPVFLLALQTIGQLQARDFVLVSIFIAIAVFYVLKRSE